MKTLIKVLKRDGQAVLVEWLDGDMPRRVFLPTAAVPEPGTIDTAELERGIPYGVEWAAEIELQATATDLQCELRRAQIWTAQDAIDRPGAVAGIIQKIYGIDLATVLRCAREHRRTT